MTDTVIAEMEDALGQLTANQPRHPGELPPEVADLLSGLGLTSLCLPRRLGGSGGELLDLVDAIERVAGVDASAAWVLFITATAPWLLAHASPDAVAEVYADPGTRVGGALAPTGEATPSGAGYLVSGRWAFGSGVSVCHWLAVHVRVGAGSAFALVPGDVVAYQEPWDGFGLRSTGSGAFGIEEEFVPAHRMVFGLDSPRWPEPLFRLPFRVTFACAAAVLLGVGFSALDQFVVLAATKKPTFGRARLADQPRVQALVAECSGALWAARAALRESVSLIAANGAEPALRARLRVAINHVRATCVDVVGRVHAAAGSAAISDSSVFVRALQDVHTAAQHYLFSDEISELAGAVLLGGEVDEVRL
jgi:indole-3-acetate monooxygenase